MSSSTMGRTRRVDRRWPISKNGLLSGYGGGTTDMRRELSRALPCVALKMFSSIASSTSRRARTDCVLKTLSSPSFTDGL